MMSVLWIELTAEQLRLKAEEDALVVVPVASIEQHGPHLPVGVDTIICERICRIAAEQAREEAKIVVAPTLWCGLAEHHMDLGGTFTFDFPLYRLVLLNILKNIQRHGYKRVLIVNGHGGNREALIALLSDFSRETKLRVRITHYTSGAIEKIKTVLEDQDFIQHACEAETSLMMSLTPDLVRLDRIAEAFGRKDQPDDVLKNTHRFRSFKTRIINGVQGDARRASPEKGRSIEQACILSLAALMRHPNV